MCDHFSFENSNGDHYDHLAREKSKHALFNDSPRPKWCFFSPHTEAMVISWTAKEIQGAQGHEEATSHQDLEKCH